MESTRKFEIEIDRDFILQDLCAYSEDRAEIENRIDKNGFISCIKI